MSNVLRFALSCAFLSCPSCPCPVLFCPALLCPALPCLFLLSPAQPSPVPVPAPVTELLLSLFLPLLLSLPVPVPATVTSLTPVLSCPELNLPLTQPCRALPYVALPFHTLTSFHVLARAFLSVLPSCHSLHPALPIGLPSTLLCTSSCPPTCSVPALPPRYPVLWHSPCHGVLAAAPYQSVCIYPACYALCSTLPLLCIHLDF